MVLFKTDTVEVSLPDGQADVQPSVSRLVHIQPATPSKVYEEFGVEVDANFVLYDEPEAAAYYAEFGVVSYDGVDYAITLPPLKWDIVGPAGHVAVALTRKD